MALELRSLERAARRLRLAQRVQVSPTIVIGLGGSGTYTARRLKRLMEQRYGLPPLVRFLYIDCDQRAFATEPSLADVKEEEKVTLHLSNPEQILRDAIQGIGRYGLMRDWLPDELRYDVRILRNAEGAGGIRPVGRFAFFANLDNFVQRFQFALNGALAIEQELATLLGDLGGQVEVNTNQMRLYIVGSLCGGTGSSLFLDVAVLARHFIRQQAPNASPSITGIFYLPSVFQNESAVRNQPDFFDLICANAYAGLMELEYFCDSNQLQSQPFTFRYPHIGTITVNSAVYDEDFVVEAFTPDGRCLLSKGEVFEMVARSLLVDIGSPAGAYIRSANANIVTVLTMEPCPVTKKRRTIHSLGTTSVAFPVWEMLKYSALKILHKFLSDKVLGSKLSDKELESEINGFLQAHRLDERGERNDLLEALLSREDGEQVTYSPPRTREELEEEAGGGEVRQAQFVANWVENELNRVSTQVILEARRTVEGRKVKVLRDAIDALASKLENLTRAKGLSAAENFIAELIHLFESVRDELVSEQQKYETEQRPSLQNTINNQVSFLRSLQGLWGSIRALGRADEHAMDVALRALREYGKAEIMGIARQAAMELIGSEHLIEGYPSLLNCLRDWQQQIEKAIVKVKDLVQICTKELSARYQKTPTGSNYIIEQWVVSPSEFDEWLEKLGTLNYDESALWQAMGKGWQDWLKTLTARPEELLDKLAANLADNLVDKFKGWDILRVIEEKRKTDEGQRVDAILKTMAQVCQPFWSAPRHAPGGVAYQTFMAFTIPIGAEPSSEEDERYQEIRRTLRDLAQNFGYHPELVHSGFPFALEMVVRVYGARAFYLTSTSMLRQQYDKFKPRNEFQLLHLDRRFLDLIPTLHEHETGDEG